MLETSPAELLHEGVAAAKVGNKDLARQRLTEAVQLDPTNEEAWLWLAGLAETPAQAVHAWAKVLDVNPNSLRAQREVVSARLRFGIAEAKAGNAESARGLLHEVLADAPRNEIAWHWLASVAATPEEAEHCLREVLSINPQNARARADLDRIEAEKNAHALTCPLCSMQADEPRDVCVHCGSLLTVANLDAFPDHKGANPTQLKTAIAHYEQAVQQGPNFDAQYALGLAYLNLKQWDRALTAFRAAIVVQPRNAELRTLYNTLAARKRDFDEKARRSQQQEERRILVVDDSPTVRKLVAMTLEREGYLVAAAANGYEAADQIRLAMPHLVLLDIMMPGMDGYQVCKSIKSQKETAKIPVIMLSGKDGFFDKVRGKLAGSTDYLTKPFDPQELVRVVAKHCGAGKRTPK